MSHLIWNESFRIPGTTQPLGTEGSVFVRRIDNQRVYLSAPPMTGFNFREAMADGSARYPMTGLIEMGGGFIGGKHQATRGRARKEKPRSPGSASDAVPFAVSPNSTVPSTNTFERTTTPPSFRLDGISIQALGQDQPLHCKEALDAGHEKDRYQDEYRRSGRRMQS